ncbi:MAG: cupin domain-containing protein [candidate division Zixibacteria bacterium]|nr:cupin domain-containing protein [candidate division Zixibacteria bacterium]
MKMRKEDMSVAIDLPVATFQREEWDDSAVAFVKLKAGADATPLLEGLPGDRCQCPHWGYMLEGAINVTYDNGEKETCRAGEVFYWPAGHTVSVEEDTSFVEFSPTKELRTVYDHIGKKAETMA